MTEFIVCVLTKNTDKYQTPNNQGCFVYVAVVKAIVKIWSRVDFFYFVHKLLINLSLKKKSLILTELMG